MKDKELEEQIRDISFETISEMLDNPDSYGLYPTTKAFERIDREVLNLIAQERRKAKIEVLEKPILLELHIKQSQDYKQGFRDAVEQVESYRKDKLAELKEDKERKQ